jgi:hypothetical protein
MNCYLNSGFLSYYFIKFLSASEFSFVFQHKCFNISTGLDKYQLHNAALTSVSATRKLLRRNSLSRLACWIGAILSLR